MDPLFAYAYYGRAEVHYYRENWSQAAEDYEVAVRLMSPKDVWYESGKKHLQFSRNYARRSGSREIGHSSRDGCAELRGTLRGTRKLVPPPQCPLPNHASSNQNGLQHWNRLLCHHGRVPANECACRKRMP